MNSNSKYFDSIRIVKGRKKPGAGARQTTSEVCQWEGCEKPGTHKAPVGRDREGQYLNFCIEHVREYNKSYNYFTGMKDEDVTAFQADARRGHRPTWRMGENAAATSKVKREKVKSGGFRYNKTFSDPFDLLGEGKGGEAPRRRTVRNLASRASPTTACSPVGWSKTACDLCSCSIGAGTSTAPTRKKIFATV